MKSLYSFLSLSTLTFLFNGSPILAAIQPNYYYPKSQSCAVYRGGIDSEKVFTFWIENKRKFTVEADDSLKIAVTLGNKIIAPYNIASLPDNEASQFTYRTSTTGNHNVLIRGISSQAKITICLD
jgi:hypothetical protein